MNSSKKIVAIVGMPGSGKSEVAAYLEKKGVPFVRFGEVTDEGLKAANLPINPDNERMFREKLRKELGMEAYAIKVEPKIKELLTEHSVIALDGLYSWEEYVYLKKHFENLLLLHIYAEPEKRYQRLSTRAIRPVPLDKCFERDVAEVENLNKGGPIAIADYLVENTSDDLKNLHTKLDALLGRLGVSHE